MNPNQLAEQEIKLMLGDALVRASFASAQLQFAQARIKELEAKLKEKEQAPAQPETQASTQ